MTNSQIVDKGHGCVFWNGARSDTGYGRIRNPFAKLNDQPAFYRTHRLVYLLNNIDAYSDMILPKSDLDAHDLDVSHICHNKLCINIQHLVFELHYINCNRRQCVHDNVCSGSHYQKMPFIVHDDR